MTGGNDRVKLAAIVGLCLLVPGLVVVIALQTVVIWSIVSQPEVHQADLAGTLEMFVDQQVEAGYADPLPDLTDPLLRDRKVLINHAINARSARDVSARLMLLDRQDASKPIDLYISTQGGWVDSAFTIIDTMQLISAPVNTWAVGGCYSAGALILAAGTGTRYATENALIMVHANQEESEEDFSFERLSRGRYEQVWRMTAGLPAEWFPMIHDQSYYLSPDEALRFGLVDRVVPVWGEE